MGAGPRISHACRRTSAGRGGRSGSPGAASGPDGTLRFADVRAPPSRGSPWTFALLPTSLPATSSCRRDATWDTARQAWNLAVDQRPVAVVYPESADDVVATVRFAAEHGLRHRLQRRRPQHRPDRLERGTPCSSRRSACAGSRSTRTGGAHASRPGCSRSPSPIAAGEHGLAYLAGTSPDVGVLGYALGGGLSWMIRSARPGLQHHRGGRRGHGRRTARPGRPRHGAGAVLGAARRQRQRGRRDRAGARAVPGRRDLRRRDALADRARDGDPERLARVDRDRPRDVRVIRPDAPAAGRPVPAR